MSKRVMADFSSCLHPSTLNPELLPKALLSEVAIYRAPHHPPLHGSSRIPVFLPRHRFPTLLKTPAPSLAMSVVYPKAWMSRPSMPCSFSRHGILRWMSSSPSACHAECAGENARREVRSVFCPDYLMLGASASPIARPKSGGTAFPICFTT